MRYRRSVFRRTRQQLARRISTRISPASVWWLCLTVKRLTYAAVIGNVGGPTDVPSRRPTVNLSRASVVDWPISTVINYGRDDAELDAKSA